MCGICGVVALRDGVPPPRAEALEAMIAALRHRGPEQSGWYRDARAGLGHARLSIVDPLAGRQPMANADRALWLSFNGEIFNYGELRAELAGLGHHFATRSDTEVVLHAYEAWGERAFERFNGQFAIAIWDSRGETLVLARDRHGIQPLHYCEHGGRLWFASEVKALFAGAPSFPRALDPLGLAETFTFWSAVPPQSVFQGVKELEPGHVRTVSPRGTSQRAFCTPHYAEDFQGNLDEAAAGVRETLEQAVRLRVLRADVPVAAYLSGGLDSSLVAALGRRAKAGSFSTFSMRFEDAEYDETGYQRAVASLIGSDHHEIVVRHADIAAAFPDAVRHAERPLLRTAPVPLFLLSRLVRDAGIKVVLTGEGADEIFAGYDLFKEGRVRRFWGRSSASRLRPRLLARLYPYLARSPVSQPQMAQAFFGCSREQWRAPGFAHQTRWRSAAALQRLFRPEWRREMQRVDVVERLLATLPGEFASWSPLAQDQYLEARTLLAGYLLSAQGDRMLMAHSVEGRFPFLDTEVTRLANSLPASYKLRGLDEKHVLKRAAAGLLPQAVIERRKQPYRAPDAASFVGPAAPAWVCEVLSARNIDQVGIFDASAVDRLWRKCQSTRGPFSNADNMALTGVLSTQLLHLQLVQQAPVDHFARKAA
jgi:asparagine synthase (glutamine-hydrolysing)